MVYSFERAYSSTRLEVRIVPLRGSVLCSDYYISISQSKSSIGLKSNQYRFGGVYWVCYNKGLMSDSIASGERTMKSYYRSEKLDSALFASMHASRIRCTTFLVDLSIISRLSHFIDTSSGPPTAKSHRYWANEIAMWDERSEISVEHQWRCRMSHSTSRQCTLVSIATFRRKVLAPQCIFQPILDICCHIDAAPHEKRTQNIGALEISMPSPYKSALFSAESCRIIEDSFVRFCTLRISAWPSPPGSTSLEESAGSNDSHPHVSIDQESTALRKLARKLQNTHRWGSLLGSFRQYIAEKVCMQCNDSHPHLSIDQWSTALGKLARKL